LVITMVQAAPTSYSQVPDNLPENLQAPKDQRLILKAMAKGSQIYTCQAKANAPNTFEWTFKAPEAELFDEEGNILGRHLGSEPSAKKLGVVI
jgi:Protein of unknown function (DUF3455)